LTDITQSPDWNIYFCGRFSEKPVRSRTFKGNDDKFTTYENATRVSGEERVGGAFTFDSTSVSSRVGISFMSTKRACENLDKRLDGNRSFEYLVKKAEERWNSVLSRIQIEPEKDDDKKLLYSSMYGMFLIPSNRTGENPHWKSDEPYYDDVFTLWDTHRSHTALFHILQPVAYEEFIRSLIDIWRHDGWMPDARSSNFNGRVQGGSNADNVLADAFVKGVRGGINWEDAYRAMKTNAEVVPANNNDPSAPDSSTKEGRGALADWKKYGYITPDYSRSVSRAVEYSANDFALYQVAKGLGKQEDADKYLNRSRNWRNHWNKNATSNGHSGFLVPRYANGSFAEQDPTDCGGCYWKDAYFQDNPWLYSLNALHDVWHLKDLIGGEDKFIDRLDKLFDLDLFNAGNEPGFVAPYLYNFARLPRQHLSAKRSRQISSLYGSGNDGLPGNSDAGAMEANLLWQMIGLYPVCINVCCGPRATAGK
jgi:predicted alpha-1,2-mannosidase